jgi:transcription elongation factor GreA
MSGIHYLTEEGFKKLQEEINHLKTVERPAISRQIAEARDKGDLSENAEYDAAKDAQGMLELKIAKLEETLSQARILDESKVDRTKVSVLTKVRIRNLASQQETDYTLVSENEADLKNGKISVTSPIGQGLLGRKAGETVEIRVPSGTLRLKILSLSR